MKNLYKKIKNYNGKKVVLILTGGGLSSLEAAKQIGSSKIIHAVYVPYSLEESYEFIGKNLTQEKAIEYSKKSVSSSAAISLCLAGQARWPSTRVIACTAALTTNRYRRGENLAFIAENVLQKEAGLLRPKPIVQKVVFSKLTKDDYSKEKMGYVSWKRISEDHILGERIIKTIFDESDL